MADILEQFKTILLYDQSRNLENGEVHNASVYTVSYYYPNASHPTVIRLKINCVFEIDNKGIFYPLSGWSEKWSSDGWVMLDESFDTKAKSPEEFRSEVIQISKSFLLGVPLEKIEIEKVDKVIETPPHVNEPRLRVVKFPSVDTEDE